jgi:hypothetical protein
MHFLWTSGIPPTQKILSSLWNHLWLVMYLPLRKNSQIVPSSQLLGKIYKSHVLNHQPVVINHH